MSTKEIGKRSRLKIGFFHNTYINYRLPLFERLAGRYDITFYFDEVYPMTAVSSRRFDYKVLRSLVVSRTYNITVSPTLGPHLLKQKPNLFLGSGMSLFGTQIAFLISRLTRKPFVLWDETWNPTGSTPRKLMWPLMRALLVRAEAIVVPGSKAREFVIAAGAKPAKVFVAPNAAQIPTSKEVTFVAEGLRERFRAGSKKVVLYFGRLVERKGLSILIEAFARVQADVKDVFLLVAGDGPFRDEAERKCRILAVRDFCFTGFVSEEEKASYLSLADVFVLPSILLGGEVEVWGLVLNEAMSLAKPVISTDAVGGAYDLITDGVNGYIVKEGDVEALYGRLKKLLTDENAAMKMGFEAKKTVDEGFTFELMTEGFVQAFHHVIGA